MVKKKHPRGVWPQSWEGLTAENAETAEECGTG